MDTKSLRKALNDGEPIDVGALLDFIERLQSVLQKAEAKALELEKMVEKLSGSVRLEDPYSVSAEEKRQQERELKKSRKARDKTLKQKLGRRSNDTKLKAAERIERVIPEGFTEDQCVLSHVRPVFRFESNRALIVAYEVWVHRPTKTYGKIPGVIGRSGYGLEFILAVAYQVYSLGLSFDKVALLTQFFQGLKIGKSQIDAMLNQLARHLEREFDNLCSLVANSMILHADETSWSINSVWAFVTESARVLLHGVHKDASTLEVIVNPAMFGGLVVSDDAAVYSRFNKTQKCWAHLLRKSIRICLLQPNDQRFEALRDGLFEIYRKAVRLQDDRRYQDEGRRDAVYRLQDKLHDLICVECEIHEGQCYQGALEEFRLLINELLKLSVDESLFSFVTTPPAPRPNGTELQASGTNNEAERTLRLTAKARKCDQASKTVRGARRRTIIVSTMESVRYFVRTYTLATITAEILSWTANGVSCFELHLQSITNAQRLKNTLAKLYPTAAIT
jgi:hypothetical protein